MGMGIILESNLLAGQSVRQRHLNPSLPATEHAG
jgi:hypothetical protein